MTTETLIADLARDGDIVTSGDGDSEWLILRYLDRRFDPPVKLVARDNGYESVIDSTIEDGRVLFPDVAPRTGAHRLLLANLEEILQSAVVPPQEVRLTDGRIIVQAGRQTGEMIHTDCPSAASRHLRWVADPIDE